MASGPACGTRCYGGAAGRARRDARSGVELALERHRPDPPCGVPGERGDLAERLHTRNSDDASRGPSWRPDDLSETGPAGRGGRYRPAGGTCAGAPRHIQHRRPVAGPYRAGRRWGGCLLLVRGAGGSRRPGTWGSGWSGASGSRRSRSCSSGSCARAPPLRPGDGCACVGEPAARLGVVRPTIRVVRRGPPGMAGVTGQGRTACQGASPCDLSG